jgi:hypothetical protein
MLGQQGASTGVGDTRRSHLILPTGTV